MARSFICLRYFLLSSVILLGITGVAVSFGSGYFIYQLYEYAPLTPNNVCGPPAVLLGMGILACLLGWCGFQSLDYNNVTQTVMFTILLTLITITEMSTGIWALIKHQKIEEVPLMEAKKAFFLATTDLKKVWDRMQSRLGCCGLHGKVDYADFQGPPWSCFKVSSAENSQDPDTVYKIGCLFAAVNHTRSVLLNVFLTALGSVLLQICFLIAAACFLKAVRKKKEKRKQQILEAARSAKDSDTHNQILKSKNGDHIVINK